MIIYNPTKEHIALAAKILQDVGIVSENNYPEVFDGYVSSFGASIAQCGINVTLQVFESTDSNAEIRKWLPEVIRLYLIDPNDGKWKNKLPTDKPLARILRSMTASQKDVLEKDIENASVAFKVALRMFKGSKDASNNCAKVYSDNLNNIEKAELAVLKEEIAEREKQEKERKEQGLPEPEPDTRNMGYEFQYNNIDITSWRDLSTAIAINNEILATLKRQKDYHCLSFRVQAPGLLIGSGLTHGMTGEDGDFKCGMQFDYTTGLPVIPGSSVKGVLKSYFRDFARFFWPEGVNIENLIKQIFTEGNDKDVFADALLTKAGKDGRVVGEDYITPHYPNLLKDPKPIKILKVLPGVEFTFCFKLTASADLTAQKKLECFKTILQTVGIGAKTNVGYGRLIEVQQ